MLKLLTCSGGHFWEAEGDGAPCPECGGAAEALLEPDLAPVAVFSNPERKEPPPPVANGRPVIAGYDILEDLGPTPAGFRLYRAKQHLVNREVLLEVVLAREDPTQRSWSSLRSEAGLLGKLRHPNIRAILEAGERDRQLFYNVVELIDGPTLAQHVAQTPLTVPQAVRLVEKLARAVEHAHRRDVGHRHLEPAKVLLQPTEERSSVAACQLSSGSYIPRIVGFGLPRRPVEGDASDAGLYTDPGFLSPEQAWGRTKDLGPATDVYGLGGILYFLLTGRAPFRGPTLGDALDAIQTAKLIPPSEFRQVPADVEFVCLKALSRPPRQRHPNAAALAEDLRRVGAGLAPVGGPSGAGARLRRWVRRGSAATALGCFLLAGLAAWVGYRAGESRVSPYKRTELALQNDRDIARRDAAALRARVDDLERLQRFLAFRQKLERVTRALTANDPDHARILLDSIAIDERRLEWHCLRRRIDGAERLPLPAGAAKPACLVFHPSDPGVVAACWHGSEKEANSRVELWRLEAMPGRFLTIRPTSGLARGLAFSPDGSYLAVASGSLATYHTLAGESFGKVSLSRTLSGRQLAAVAWVPKGEAITVATTCGKVLRFHLGTTTVESVLGRPENSTSSKPGWTRLAYCPDGLTLAICREGDGEVSLSWSAGGTTRVIGPGNVLAFAYSHDNELAIARTDGSIRFHEPRNGEQVGLIEHLPSAIRQVAFSPDGQRLAAALEGGVTKVFGKVGNAWYELIELTGDGTVALAFNATGRALGTAGSTRAFVFGSTGD